MSREPSMVIVLPGNVISTSAIMSSTHGAVVGGLEMLRGRETETPPAFNKIVHWSRQFL
jgi:hypothetical protein